MYRYFRIFLVVFFGNLFVKDSYCCCCSLDFCWEGMGECCGCNLFNCNCEYKPDGYCYIRLSVDKCVKSAYGVPPQLCASVNEPRTIFKTLDINEDGSVSVDEVEKSKEYINRFRPSGSKMNVTHILRDLDLNNDGLIQPTEIDDSLG